ncbi:hypothetical protein HPB48_026528 [Haemaphysalis longicornis]|uniref:CCHC-type domain-containing protein n=1 Tax=Haemaphysalis longicornis TaxID=44386 RepID=A0A9J6HCE6_HAELO|nr:hypothetical protein HPB48_026528 [Haemaphysalis longicornis]
MPSLRNFAYKIVIKPKTTVSLRSSEREIVRSIKEALSAPLREGPLIRIHEQQNIIIACTCNEEDAVERSKIQLIRLAGKEVQVAAYPTLPTDVCRRIIHGVSPDASNGEIEREIQAPGFDILGARRLGKTNSAMIVFAGNKVPNTMTYEWLEKRCYIHRKTRPVCFNCGEPGHSANVCPKPKGYACAICGRPNPAEEHPCSPVCALCKGSHQTYAKECPLKFFRPDKPSTIADGEHKNEKNGEGRSQSRGRQQVRLRTSMCTSTSTTRGRSSLRGRFTSRRRQSARKARNTISNREGHTWSDKPWSHSPARQTSATKQTSSGRLLPAVEKTSSKVSCADWPPLPTHAQHTQQNDELQTLGKENSTLKARLAVMEARIEEVTKNTQQHGMSETNTNSSPPVSAAAATWASATKPATFSGRHLPANNTRVSSLPRANTSSAPKAQEKFTEMGEQIAGKQKIHPNGHHRDTQRNAGEEKKTQGAKIYARRLVF